MPDRRIKALLLVYDTTSGPLQTQVDIVRKILHINGCPLCDTTHGPRDERSDWKSCKEELGVEIRYFHRDGLPPELERVVAGRFPCIVAEVEGGALLRLLEPEVLYRCRRSVRDLRGRIEYYAASQALKLR